MEVSRVYSLKTKEVIIPESVEYDDKKYIVTAIGDKAFYFCDSIVSVILPRSIKTIGEDAFSFCKKLNSIDIPSSVDTIGVRAFDNCTEIISINIQNGVSVIEDAAFIYCYGLTSIFLKWHEPIENVDNYIFAKSVYESADLHIPEGSLEAYQSVEPWKYFKNIKTWSSINGESSKNDIFYNDVDETIYLNNKMTSVIIYDIEGKIVKESNNTKYVRISELPLGVYIALAKGGRPIKFRK